MWKLGVFVVMLTLSPAANAAGTCGPRSDVQRQLDGRYREVQVGVGVATSGDLIEVFTSDNGTTWTIVVTAPSGISCIVATGVDWQALENRSSRHDPQI